MMQIYDHCLTNCKLRYLIANFIVSHNLYCCSFYNCSEQQVFYNVWQVAKFLVNKWINEDINAGHVFRGAIPNSGVLTLTQNNSLTLSLPRGSTHGCP